MHRNTTDNLFFDLGDLKYLGVGSIIGKTVRIRRPEQVMIGDYCIIDDFTYISCSLEMGRYCHIASNVTISGGDGRVTMGDYVGVSAGSCIFAASSDYITPSLDLPSVPKEFHFGGIREDVLLHDYVLLGAHTVVLPGVQLPEGFACAAQSVIAKAQYKPWTLYGGRIRCTKVALRDPTQLRRQTSQLESGLHARVDDDTTE